jgi:3-hydroxyisobutyrate dehydrogenase
MGMGMARSLLAAGFTVQGFDVAATALDLFAAAGGLPAGSAAGAADGAGVVVIMVLNDAQAEQALFGAQGAVNTLAPGALVMLCSTVAPSFVRTVAQRLAARAIDLLDAPVSGGVARAAEGRLSIMASGSQTAFAKAEPLLTALAEHVYRMGDEPGQGTTMKLVNQLLAGVHIAAAAEALAFGVRAGIDPNRIYEVICNSAGSSWMFQNRVPHILADDYTPHSALEIWLKDLGLVLETGKAMSFPVPLAGAALQLFIMAAAAGHARLDDAAVVKVFEQLADFRVVNRSDPVATAHHSVG